MKTIVLTHSAAKELDNLDAAAREQVSTGLVEYAVSGRGDVKRMSGRDGYRMRIGRYRVIFDQDAQTVLAICIGKRETTIYHRH